ncbi:MAG TPA: hypothetical protein VJN18_34505 [Polyangiaceae bacterium]|nr:hypothetical protein [Polyangiaceae bacterium]
MTKLRALAGGVQHQLMLQHDSATHAFEDLAASGALAALLDD